MYTRSYIASDKFYTDNGFYNKEVMNSFHNKILTYLDMYPPMDNVLDLGCGNGLLLLKIQNKFNVNVFGIERDRSKIFYDFIKCDDIHKYHLHFNDIDTILTGVIGHTLNFKNTPRQCLEYNYEDNCSIKVTRYDNRPQSTCT